MNGKNPRPTAPHLQVYKLPLTAVISITHRITGVCLTFGLIIVVYLLSTLTPGEGGYQIIQQWAKSWLFQLAYFGFIFALFFHLCHGIRHLFWDMGKGFEVETLQKYALIELACAAVLSLATWGFI